MIWDRLFTGICEKSFEFDTRVRIYARVRLVFARYIVRIVFVEHKRVDLN